jgi:hypothetical protein
VTLGEFKGLANGKCIYPTDHGRSSRSKSPTLAAQSTFEVVPQLEIYQNASIPTHDPSSTSFDYFSQLQSTQPAFNMNPANNAMSIWNPNTSTPSPSSLLASLFGSQAVDLIQPSPPAFNVDAALGQSSAFHPSVSGAQASYDFNTSPSTNSAEKEYMHGFNWYLEDRRPTLETVRPFGDMASSESTPISLNSDTAFNSTYALVQPEYRDRPEHPSYLYQLQVLESPDQLAQFFPSLEQRHQVNICTSVSALTSSFAISFTKRPDLFSSFPPHQRQILSSVISRIWHLEHHRARVSLMTHSA